MALIQDFKFQTSVLEDASWQEVTPRFIGVLRWMNEKPEIKTILDELRTDGPMAVLLKQTAPITAATSAASARAVAQVGLAMIERCDGTESIVPLFQMTRTFGIQDPGNLMDREGYLSDAA